MTKKNCVK